MKNIRLIMLVFVIGFLISSAISVVVCGSIDSFSADSDSDSEDESVDIGDSSSSGDEVEDSPPSDSEDAEGYPSGSNGDDPVDGGSSNAPEGPTLPNDDEDPAVSTDDAEYSQNPAINEPPVADAGGPYYGHVGEVINFDGSGSWDPDGNIVGYKWDFNGDGIWDTGWLTSPFAYHTYSVANDYTVKLIVKDDGNENGNNVQYDIDDTTAYITVNQDPVAIINPDEVTVWVGEKITLYGGNSYDPDGSIDNYKWFIQDEDGYWELLQWGQNDTFIKTFDEVDSYYVRLEVIDDDDASDYADSSVLVHNGEDPLAVIDLVDEADKNVDVEFVGSNSWDPDGYIVSWYWDFGCGTTDSGEIVYHEYTNIGSYAVTLTVTDNRSNTHMSTDRINISSGTGGSPYPSGPLNLGGDDLLLNGDITGAPSSSPELPEGILSTTSSFLKVKILERISQTLSKISFGSMLLESINSKIEILSDGDSSTTNFLGLNFSIGISYTPWPCHENEEITFYCNIYGNPTGPLEYFWDFENDGTWDENTESAVHTYTETGSYTVVLKVRDTYNDEIATASTTILVEEAEGVNLNISSSTSVSTAMSTSSPSGNLGL